MQLLTRFAPSSSAHFRTRKSRKRKRCEPVTPHDPRRAAATHMTVLGIERLHVGKVLNAMMAATSSRLYGRYSY
jgi:hypothetical protein